MMTHQCPSKGDNYLYLKFPPFNSGQYSLAGFFYAQN